MCFRTFIRCNGQSDTQFQSYLGWKCCENESQSTVPVFSSTLIRAQKDLNSRSDRNTPSWFKPALISKKWRHPFFFTLRDVNTSENPFRWVLFSWTVFISLSKLKGGRVEAVFVSWCAEILIGEDTWYFRFVEVFCKTWENCRNETLSGCRLDLSLPKEDEQLELLLQCQHSARFTRATEIYHTHIAITPFILWNDNFE